VNAALEVKNVHKRFGGIQVLTGASLEIRPGAVTALIGSNGAGKSTLLNIVSGLTKADSGEVFLRGENISSLPAYARARKGLSRTFQHVRCFKTFSVREAVEFAGTPATDGHFGRSLLWMAGMARRSRGPRVDEILATCRLEGRAETACGSLSYGETKLLMLAQSLACDAAVQCFDELCAGLEPALIEHVERVMQDLAHQGKAVLFVEHNLQVVRDLAQYCVFLHQGGMYREGPTSAVLEDPEVVRLYLGQ